MTREAPPPHTTPPAPGTLVVEEPRFAIVPEWVIDAAVSDGAFRLYSLLLRYGNGSGSRMPSRQTLAAHLRPGWPQNCGPTQRSLPTHVLPLPPHAAAGLRRRRRRRQTTICWKPAASPTSTSWPGSA